MTTSELNSLIAATQAKIELITAKKIELMTSYDALIIELHDCQFRLSDLLQIIPADDLQTTEPPCGIPAPAISLVDGNLLIPGLTGFSIEAWYYEPATSGWATAGTFHAEQDAIFPPVLFSQKVKARYVSFGPGGEYVEQGPETVFEW